MKLTPARYMNAIVTYCRYGDGYAASEALRGENPPVDKVVKAWFTASNRGMSPTR